MAKKQEFPVLLHEDTKGYENTLDSFTRKVKERVEHIRPLYESLGLEEPFNDEVWKDLVTGMSKTKDAYQARVNAVRDLVGITSGITKGSIINQNSALRDLENAVSMFPLFFTDSPISGPQHLAPLTEVVNVATKPELSEAGKTQLLEHFRTYAHSEQELEILADLETFAGAYNRLSEKLEENGFWKREGFLHAVFQDAPMNGLFIEEKESKQPSRLKVNPEGLYLLA